MNIRNLLIGRGPAPSLGRPPPVNISSIFSPITPPKEKQEKQEKPDEGQQDKAKEV